MVIPSNFPSLVHHETKNTDKEEIAFQLMHGYMKMLDVNLAMERSTSPRISKCSIMSFQILLEVEPFQLSKAEEKFNFMPSDQI